MILLFVAIEFLCGSLMFSYWMGLAIKKDLKQIGDGNPGAFNLWHAAGSKLGLLGIFLDFMKGYLPLVLLIRLGWISGMAIVPVAIAPIFGHAFSPFLKGKGGKAIAVTFGVWSAVSGFEISLAYAIILAIFLIVVKLFAKGKPTSTETDAFMVVLGMFALGIYLFLQAFTLPFIILWLLNLLLLTYTHREKLQKLIKSVYSKYKQEHTNTDV